MKSFFSVLAVLVMFAVPAFASTPASVYVVHGIPGADLGTTPSLPVDISVNGACALKNFKFGDIAGPVPVETKATVVISLADSANPCGGPVALGPVTFPLSHGENASIVAYLTADGKPAAKKFTNESGKTSGGRSRITVHHTAAAPLVDVTIDPKVKVNQFRNGEKFTVEAPKGVVQVSIAATGATTPVFGPISVDVPAATRILVYAVGSLTHNTFTLLLKPY